VTIRSKTSRVRPREAAADPVFASARLQSVVAAFVARRRAIRYRARSFAITRGEDAESERLDVDLATIAAQPTRLRLSLWSDGPAWFGVSRIRPRASAVRFAFHAYCEATEPQALCALFERSIDAAPDIDAGDAGREALLAIWAGCAPEIDRDIRT
jgi:hypothetical protein